MIPTHYMTIFNMKYSLCLTVLLTVARSGFCGLCRVPPLDEQVCTSPLVFRGEVQRVEESMDITGLRILNSTYTVNVQKIYRVVGEINLNEGELVIMDSPNQMLSTAFFLVKGKEYLIQALGFREKNGNKMVSAGLCEIRHFSDLRSEEVNALKNIDCGDD